MANKSSVTWGKRLLLAILLVFVVMQIIPRDRPDGSHLAPEAHMAYSLQPPADVQQLLEVACYDCHSYETTYPWYSKIAPVSFWIDHHIEEGREHVNFAEWASYDPKDQAHMMEECAEEVLEGEMPFNSYTWLHSEAALSNAQRQRLAEWFNSQSQPRIEDGFEKIGE